ncbi:TPA: hypothetical protein ACXN3T_003581 [Proteus mirabilis]
MFNFIQLRLLLLKAMMLAGTVHNIAITPTTKLLKPNTATSLNAKARSFSTITT